MLMCFSRGKSQQLSTTTMENGDGKKKTIEGTYQKKTQLEHILIRPDTYIGSVEQVTEAMWVYDKEEERMVQREITYVPGLYKIYDEILVNAADNKQRDPKMDKIKIDIKQEDNTISVWNNGKGIPVAIHKEENMYVPTMIFGHLLTSSNYDDAENKVTGGRNGYGAKLCNIFSGRFVVETSSKEYKKSFKQSWANNMNKCSEVRIKESSSEDFTKVTFSPDLEKFKMTKLDDDIVSLMTRRAYDCAASTKGVKIYLNGTLIPIKGFKDYCELFIKGRTDDSNNQLKLSYEQCGPRWEVAVALSPDNSFKQMSFVNSIATTKGGKHVDHVSDAIVKKLQDTLKKKNKEGAKLDKKSIKQHMWIFINCLITNPTFDSQTKENMTLVVSKFGSKYEVTDKFITGISKLGIIESILHWAKFKADTQLQKLTGGSSKKKKIIGIPKLDDAHNAGTSKSIDCTLILTEGDSAKALAVSGVSSVDKGRDIYGVFPLKGKLLNVREATHKQIIENAEINNLIKILGLQYKKKYETLSDLKTLRYGKLMIMTDQDQDGSHIKGLLINFIHHNWPSLLKLNFIEEFITPLIKVTKGNEKLSFYSTAEYEEWRKDQPAPNKIKPKYYKGLGTSTSKEAKEYFSDMQKHRIAFTYAGDEDDKNIVMAFSKKACDQRKDWLTNYMTTTKDRKERGLGEKFLYHKNTRSVTYTDFINVELVSFSNYDNVRSIPNVIDGLKPGQRKVMYVCMLRNDKNEVKVAQLGASVAEKSDYHHGETSLTSTIVNLAQDYVGSNNINLLLPIGQFGSRSTGGKDAASPRYIFTKLSPLTRLIFHKHDDALLQHEISDNKKIEPTYYIPIIPMILVNGADGIGTGWMTKIPNHNPREIIQNLYNMMDGNDIQPMKPYWKNFKGEIEHCGDTRYAISGEITIIGNDKIQISELPIGTWTNHYKETVLDVMLSNESIVDYKDYSDGSEINFLVTVTPQKLRDYERDGVYKVFKLQTTISMSSMCAFDKNLCLNKYDDITRIMREFYDLRLEFYVKRKNYLTGILEAEARKLTNQARFILEKCDGTLVIEKKKKKAMIDELIAMGYDSDPVSAWKATQKNSNEVVEDDENNDETEEINETPDAVDYDYLLGMAMWSLTKEKIDELLKKRDDKKTELDILKSKTPKTIWRDDLDALLIALNDFEEKQIKEERGDKKPKQKKKGGAVKEIKYETGRKIKPEFDAEMKKKYEKLDQQTKDKKQGIVKKPKVKKEIGAVKEEKDEFDVMIESNAKSLDDRLGLSPVEKKTIKKTGGGRQTTLPFKPIDKKTTTTTKQKRKSKGSDDSDDDSDPDIDFESISPPPVSRGGTRRAAAATKKTYNLDSDEDKDDSDELEFKSDNDEAMNESIDSSKQPSTISSPVLEQSDSDNDFQPNKKLTIPKQSSEELFDSLVGVTPEKTTNNKVASVVLSSCDDSTPVKPTKTTKKTKTTTTTTTTNKKKNENGSGSSSKTNKRTKNKKRSSSDSDSDEIYSTKSRKRAKKSESSDDDFVDDSPVVPKKTTSSRSRKVIQYRVSNSDSDSD
ncbi:hypothetical protein HCN44_003744 [Aphidius gifuensis]|uniref:DNA topoisomerase 2 n=1 Tax=Aphidius gifuensis TaxID=684658 RepID=A0A834XJ08_APHGI|nr:hypothetical protein HCN44_003744 [Aphidius gifuensis]